MESWRAAFDHDRLAILGPGDRSVGPGLKARRGWRGNLGRIKETQITSNLDGLTAGQQLVHAITKTGLEPYTDLDETRNETTRRAAGTGP